MTGDRSPLDAALDLLVYAPVGLAITLGEEVPRLAAKGRASLDARVSTARVVGQFAVARARRRASRRMQSSAPRPASPRSGAGIPTSVPAAAPAEPVGRTPGTAEAGANGAAVRAAPPVTSLAIPGYDSLSASQVVQRLAGLSRAELDALMDYEAANRGRRTILTRVGQLQSS